MSDDAVTAALGEIQVNYDEAEAARWLFDMTDRADAFYSSVMDVPRLVAAVKAVLAMAAGSQVMAADWSRCTSACEHGPCDCGGGRPLAWNLDPAKLRAAITTALTKEAGDGN